MLLKWVAPLMDLLPKMSDMAAPSSEISNQFLKELIGLKNQFNK